MDADGLLPPAQPHLLTIPETAKRLGVSAGRVDSFIAIGQLTVIYKPGSNKRHIDEADLEKFIAKYGNPPRI